MYESRGKHGMNTQIGHVDKYKKAEEQIVLLLFTKFYFFK
jgi:hypothetical protein